MREFYTEKSQIEYEPTQNGEKIPCYKQYGYKAKIGLFRESFGRGLVKLRNV